MKIDVTLPIILEFGDYHEIDWYCDSLVKVIPGVKCKEIDFFGGTYHGLFYFKRLGPAEKKLMKEHRKLAKEAEIEEDDFHFPQGKCRTFPRIR